MLASTLIPQPYSMTHAPLEDDVNMSFGRLVYPSEFYYNCHYLNFNYLTVNNSIYAQG